MAEKITKGEITYLAKRICKINEELQYACMLAEELALDETLRRILTEKDEAVLHELREKVLKYGDLDSPTDVTACEYYLEEASKILSAVFYED